MTSRNFLVVGVAAGTLLWASAASAAQIAAGSQLSINGPDMFTPTSITFTGSGNVQGRGGSFTELALCTSCVTMIPSLTAASSGTLYTVTDGADTSTLTLTGPLTFTPGGSAALPSLTVDGNGTLTLTGFD